MNELVSIIIPTYNREGTIEQAVKSVLYQSYSPIEVIIVDDCSVDHTEAVINSIQDTRVAYYKLEAHYGACAARNYGVTKAKGEIIAFQDSDDVWDREKIAREVAFLKENDLEFVSCGIRRFHEDGRIEDLGKVDFPGDKVSNWCKLLNGNWVSTQTIVCRKYCFEKIQFDKNLKRYQDWDFALQASMLYRMGALKESLVDSYIQRDSITRTVSLYDSKLAVIKKHKSDIVKNDKRMISQYYKSLGGVERLRDTGLAAKYYWKSFVVKPGSEKFVLWVLSITGLIKIRDRRKNIE